MPQVDTLAPTFAPSPESEVPTDMYFNLALFHRDDHCIGLRSSSARIDSTLELMPCDISSMRQHFRYGNNTIRVEIGGGLKCLQAGLDGPAEDGEFVRIKYCDPDNELQKFTWPQDSGTSISLVNYPHICLANHGVTIDYGDRMVLKECQLLQPERAKFKAIGGTV
jgi:hypothetical protein